MNNTSVVVEFIVGWVPVIVLFALAAWFLIQQRKRNSNADETNDQLININREMLAELREIKNVLNSRNT